MVNIMRRDTRRYDKYLNMKNKEKKKLDFIVRFDSKAEKVGVIILGVGLLLLCVCFIYMFTMKYDDNFFNNLIDIFYN